MGYMIWYYISWNFGMEDMILYPISEKKSYHIYIFFSLECLELKSVILVNSLLPLSLKRLTLLLGLSWQNQVPYIRCWRGAVNSIKLLTTRFKFGLKTASNRKKLHLFCFISSKSCKSKKIVLKNSCWGMSCFVMVIWFLRRAYLMSYDWYFEDISQHCRYEGRYFLGTIDMDIDMIWYISPFHFGIWI